MKTKWQPTWEQTKGLLDEAERLFTLRGKGIDFNNAICEAMADEIRATENGMGESKISLGEIEYRAALRLITGRTIQESMKKTAVEDFGFYSMYSRCVGLHLQHIAGHICHILRDGSFSFVFADGSFGDCAVGSTDLYAAFCKVLKERIGRASATPPGAQS